MDPASLAIGIVPILAASASHWEKVYRFSKKALLQKEKDEALADFYFNLHNELTLLDLNLRRWAQTLPSLTEDQKGALVAMEQKPWEDAKVDIALDLKLGPATKDGFVECLNRILQVLNDIVSDKTIHLLKEDLVVRS
jgi:hypothetical protein